MGLREATIESSMETVSPSRLVFIEPPSNLDPATRCGVAKPLGEQTDDELVVTFRTGEEEIHGGLSRAVAGAFLCADVVATFRKRPEPPTFKEIAKLLGVEERTAQHYHTLHGRFPDPRKRPTDVPIRDLNLAYREVGKLMPDAPKETVAAAAVVKARKIRSERPAKKPRGRSAPTAVRPAAPAPIESRPSNASSSAPARPVARDESRATNVTTPATTPAEAGPTPPSPLAEFGGGVWHVTEKISRAIASMKTVGEIIETLVAIREGIQFGLDESRLEWSEEGRAAVANELAVFSTADLQDAQAR